MSVEGTAHKRRAEPGLRSRRRAQRTRPHLDRALGQGRERPLAGPLRASDPASHQLGATLAVFSAAGHPQLFAPYLVLLFSVGALHTRLWQGRRSARRLPLLQTTYQAAPRLGAVSFRVRADLWQFATRALPAFVWLCSVQYALK